MKASIWIVAAGLGLAACGSEDGGEAAADGGAVPKDTGGGGDTGDATVPDAGAGDTGAGGDTAVGDAGAADGGATDVADAAEPDAGGTPDAAVQDTAPDAAPEDAGADDTVEDTADAGGAALAGPCPLGQRVGLVEVAHWDFYASVTGEVAEGVIPLTVLQLVKEEAGCQLLQKVNPFCDPACGPGQLCKHDGTCIPYPENQSVGTMTVDGLYVPVSMEPGPTKLYAETGVPFPMFDPGAAITITASGGDLPGFTLHGTGVETLVLPDTVLEMVKGEPLAITWEPATVPTDATIYISLNVDQHGNSPVTLKCDSPDDGSFEIPAALAQEFLEFGVSGFATLDIYRRTVDSVTLAPGCVEATVFSFAPGKLTVEGHVPCFSDKDCPEGESCNVPINTCVTP